MEEQEQKISKYNSGIAQIYRLDNLWKDASNHSRVGQFQKWNCDLERIWCELARDLKETDYATKKKEFDKFDEDLSDSGKFEDNATSTFEDLTSEQVTKRNKQYKILLEKDLFLRRLENFVGKGTAWEDSEEDDW
jgi:hypothetical protein